MNCESCEEPKNSLMTADTGRMLMSPDGVISMGSCVAILSLMSRSKRAMPTRS